MKNTVCWIYILVLAFLSVYEVMSTSPSFISSKKINRKLFYLMSIILTCIYFFRDPMSGVDDGSYYSNWFLYNNSFNEIIRDIVIPGHDGGFKLIFELCKIFSKSYWFACTVVYLLTLIPLYIFILRKSKYQMLSLFIYLCYYWGASVVLHRMALCLTLGLVAWMNIDDNKNIRALFFALLAASIHISGWIILGYFLIKKIPQKKMGYVIFYLMLIAVVISEIVIPWLVAYYRDGSYVKELSYNGGWVFFLLLCIISIFLNIISKYYLKQKTNAYAYNTIAMATVLQIFAFQLSLIVRAVYLYFIQIIIAIPNCIFYIKNRETKNIILIVLIVFSLIWLWYTGEELNSMRWIV